MLLQNMLQLYFSFYENMFKYCCYNNWSMKKRFLLYLNDRLWTKLKYCKVLNILEKICLEKKFWLFFSFWGSRKLQTIMNSCEEKSRRNILVGIGCWIQEILIVLVVVFLAIKYVKVCKNVWEKFWLILTYKHGKNL